uniref:Cadherin domain-containing protein n=1 Tax=Anopheles dirus TaxID=7168 RepID=A0A182NBP0_9DIPT
MVDESERVERAHDPCAPNGDHKHATEASRIRYEITSGNIGGAFAVKNMTGAIYVAGALDYETRKRVTCSKGSQVHGQPGASIVVVGETRGGENSQA